MKKIIAIVYAAIFALFPRAGKADLDFLSHAQDKIKEAQEYVDKYVADNKLLQRALDYATTNPENLLNPKQMMKDAAKEAAAEVKSHAKAKMGELKQQALDEGAAFISTQMSSINVPGITDKIDMGAFATDDLKKALGSRFLKQKNVQDDVISIKAKEELTNNLVIDNLSVMFANALVTRKKLSDEEATIEKNRPADFKQMNEVEYQYMAESREAHHRWLTVMSLLAQNRSTNALVRITKGNVDDVDQVIGTSSQNTDESLKRPKMSVGDIFSAVKSGYQNVKAGNYAGALGDAANLYASTGKASDKTLHVMGDVMTGAQSAQNAYYNASYGNWGGALAAAGSGTGAIMGNNGNEKLGAVFGNASGNAGDALNSAMYGNWGGVVGATGRGVGGTMAITGDPSVGNAIYNASGYAGNTLNAGMYGNWTGALSSAGTGVGTTFTGLGNEQVGSAIVGASANTASGINAAMYGDWGSVVGATGGTTGSVLYGTGNGALGMEVAGVGNVSGGIVGVATDGGNASQVMDNVLYNNQIYSGLGQMGAGYDMAAQQAAQQHAIQKSQEEAMQKMKETMAAQTEEMQKQEREKCQKENEELAKAGKPIKLCM